MVVICSEEWNHFSILEGLYEKHWFEIILNIWRVVQEMLLKRSLFWLCLTNGSYVHLRGTICAILEEGIIMRNIEMKFF